MSKKELKINIIGSGVSGLIAAIVLEKAGFTPHIFESSDRVGGRVKTEKDGSFIYDYGFQVLLEAYPMAKKYLDLKALELKEFMPGSLIFKNGKLKKFGDPLRHISFLFPIILSPMATFSDKIKVFRLSQKLQQESIEQLFKKEETTSLAYLQNKGFSEKIIHYFFMPFFSGIFLETNLSTSSRMFEFVFKMFAEGKASIPKNGMEEIPKQLKAQLKNTSFHFNCFVDKVDNQGIHIKDLPPIKSDYTIIATQADKLIERLQDQRTTWKSCHCFYFETEANRFAEPIIALVPGKNLINNLHFVNNLTTDKTPLLSVTILNAKGLEGEDLINAVKKELYELCGIQVLVLKRSFYIPRALPQLNNLQHQMDPSETQLTETIFLAGDLCLNGSLNAAMQAGEAAAQRIIDKVNE